MFFQGVIQGITAPDRRGKGAAQDRSADDLAVQTRRDAGLVDKSRRRGALALWIIGVQARQGSALLGVAIGAHHLLHKDISDFVATWIAHLHLDPDNRYIGSAMAKILSLDARNLRAIRRWLPGLRRLLLTEGLRPPVATALGRALHGHHHGLFHAARGV
jgi:hypothetical protein